MYEFVQRYFTRLVKSGNEKEKKKHFITFFITKYIRLNNLDKEKIGTNL
jgi:hypothetical protein